MKYLLIIIMLLMSIDAKSNDKFPQLKAEKLSGEEITFPDDLTHKANVLLLVFERSSQPIADTWTNAMVPLEAEGQLNYFEIPMISGFYSFMSGFIDNRMKSGIEKKLHSNVATFYGDRDPYFEKLDMNDKSNCYIFLVDSKGYIKYRTEGKADDNKLNEIKIEIEKLN